jgi:hypothetical protein
MKSSCDQRNEENHIYILSQDKESEKKSMPGRIAVVINLYYRDTLNQKFRELGLPDAKIPKHINDIIDAHKNSN